MEEVKKFCKAGMRCQVMSGLNWTQRMGFIHEKCFVLSKDARECAVKLKKS